MLYTMKRTLNMNTFSQLLFTCTVCLSMTHGADFGYYKNDIDYKPERGTMKGYDKGDAYSDDENEVDEKHRGGRYYYGGKYQGECGPDGLYFRDDYSFVLCSNAKGYVQPCAPGTRNSGLSKYAPGYYYGYSDFCDINLVDYGYSAPKYGPGYAKQPSFGFAAYRRQEDSDSYLARVQHKEEGYEKPESRDYAPNSNYAKPQVYGPQGYSQESYNKDRYDAYLQQQKDSEYPQSQAGYQGNRYA